MEQKKAKLLNLMLSIIAITVFFSGCTKLKNDLGNNTTSNKPTIAVSIVPEETFVRKVCKDKVNIVTMIPPGASPESYEPTPKQMIDFENADLYFCIGVQSENNCILENISSDTKVVHLEDKVAEKYDFIYIGKERDPHIWMSPKRVIIMVENIADEMSIIDPDNKDYYNKNADEYIKHLEKLDLDMSTMLESITNRKFIVFHPAFNYLASDYDLDVYNLEKEGKEASPKQLQEMIDFAKQEGVKVIFYQAEVDSSQSEAFAENIGGKTMILSPLSANYIENYENMIKLIKEAMK